MTTNRRRSRSLTAALCTLVLAALCACDPPAGTATQRPEETPAAAVAPRFDELELPASTRPTGAVVDQPTIVGPSGDLPWYVVALRTAPESPSTVAVWSGVGMNFGQTGEPRLGEPENLPVPGDVWSVVTAADDRLAVIAGDHWVDGSHGTYLFTSTDRTAWEEVSSPELDALNVQSVVLVDGAAVAVGVDRSDDSVRALRVARDGAVSSFSIDVPPDAEGVAAAAARGDDLVVLVTGTDTAGDREVTAVRSRDGGATWSRYAVEGDDPAVHGVVALDDGFVATGSTRRELPDGPGTIATAWRVLADQDRWTVTRTDDGGEPDLSTGFSAPAPYQDGYAAVLWVAGTLYTQFWVETSRETGTVATTGPHDVVAPRGPSAATDDDVFLSVIAGSNGAHVVRMLDGWDAPIMIGTLAEPARWQDSADPDEATSDRVLVSRTHLEIDGDHWTSGPRYTELELVDDHLEARRSERGRRFVEYAPDGRAAALTVAMVSHVPADGYHMVPAVLTETGWLTFDPIEVEGFAQAGDLAWVEGRWLAAGVVARHLGPAVPDTAALWESADGRRWKHVAGFDPGDGSSAADSICAVGDTAFVTGRVDGERVVWTRDDDAWHHTVVDLEPGEDLQDCRADGQGALVQVSADEGTQLRYTEDGLSYETVHVPEPDQHFGSVVVVDGGFAARGSVTTDDWEGPVLWLSSDATDWWWTPIPADQAGWGAVYPVEGGLVVTTDGRGGMRAWHVPDVADVIAARDAGT